MRLLCSYCDRSIYAPHVVSFLHVGKEYAAQIISSRNKSRLYATHKIFFWAMSIDFATQICFYWVEKITFATRMRFFLIGRYRYATQIVIFHSGRLWFASGFYLCGARGLEILAGTIYVEAFRLKNRPKTGILDGRGLEYLIRIACDGTQGRVVLIRIGSSESLGRWKLRAFFLSFFLLFLSWHKKRRQKKVKPPQGAVSLLVGGRGRAILAGMGFSESLGRWKLGTFFFCLFLLFLSWLGERRQKKVKPPQGAVSLFAVGRGRDILTRIGFFYLLRRWKLKVLSIDIFTR